MRGGREDGGGGKVRKGEGKDGRMRGREQKEGGEAAQVEHLYFSVFTLRPGSVVTSFIFKQGLGCLSLRSSTSCTSYAGGAVSGPGTLDIRNSYHVDSDRSGDVRVPIVDVQIFPQLC